MSDTANKDVLVFGTAGPLAAGLAEAIDRFGWPLLWVVHTGQALRAIWRRRPVVAAVQLAGQEALAGALELLHELHNHAAGLPLLAVGPLGQAEAEAPARAAGATWYLGPDTSAEGLEAAVRALAGSARPLAGRKSER